MNISVKSEYALQAIFDLAAQTGTDPVKIADIANRQKIPQKFLELILAGLKQAGFVVSRRGAEGGYLLARPAAAITVGQVLRAVEGLPQKARRGRDAETPFSNLWQRVDSGISQIIDQTTFAELLREWNEKQSRFVVNWDI
jgi:Rrf2 family protein